MVKRGNLVTKLVLSHPDDFELDATLLNVVSKPEEQEIRKLG
jgi:hypothetical protein